MLKTNFKTMKGMLRAMLCQFTFRNYGSYRDEAELSMQATPMREFERSLIECPDGQSFLPVAAVYGPNAGGKSNLLEALDYVRSAVARPVWLLSARADAPEGERPSMACRTCRSSASTSTRRWSRRRPAGSSAGCS